LTGRWSKRARELALSLAAGLLGACASTAPQPSGDEAFAEGDCSTAVGLYERELWKGPRQGSYEQLLFRLGLCYVEPGSRVHDAAKAEEAFRKLAWRAPRSDYAVAGKLLLGLSQSLTAAEARVRDLEAELRSAREELEARQAELVAPEEEVGDVAGTGCTAELKTCKAQRSQLRSSATQAQKSLTEAQAEAERLRKLLNSLLEASPAKPETRKPETRKPPG
jgi:signal transduction histidine kinase